MEILVVIAIIAAGAALGWCRRLSEDLAHTTGVLAQFMREHVEQMNNTNSSLKKLAGIK